MGSQQTRMRDKALDPRVLSPIPTPPPGGGGPRIVATHGRSRKRL